MSAADSVHARLTELVYRGVDEVNAQSVSGETVVKAPDTPLLGPDSALDSVGLITLIVSLEQNIGDEFGIDAALTESEELLASSDGPFRTIDSLVTYIRERIQHADS